MIKLPNWSATKLAGFCVIATLVFVSNISIAADTIIIKRAEMLGKMKIVPHRKRVPNKKARNEFVAPKPNHDQLVKSNPDLSIDLNIGGTLFRVPCRYRPVIQNLNVKRVVCWKNPGQRIPATSFGIKTAPKRYWDADNYTKFPWVKSLYDTQIHVRLDEFKSPEKYGAYADKYLSFKNIPKSRFDIVKEIDNTGFILYTKKNSIFEYYVNGSDEEKTPLGYPIVYICTFSSISSQCGTKYKWGNNVYISYNFDPEKNRPVETWVQLDQLIRRFISKMQINDAGDPIRPPGGNPIPSKKR